MGKFVVFGFKFTVHQLVGSVQGKYDRNVKKTELFECRSENQKLKTGNYPCNLAP